MTHPILQFEGFQLDQDGYQLRRDGRSVKLERMPMELLILLAGRSGQLVTRQEIVEHLWGNDVFVDSEHGVNTAIRKIRQTLHDDPVRPRFLETVTGKGYRFVAPVSKPFESKPNNGLLTAKEIAVDDDDGKGFPNSESAGSREVVQRETDANPFHVIAEIPLPRTVTLWALGIVCLIALIVSFNGRGWATRFHPVLVKPEINSIAVLPLDNLSGDTEQDYVAAGMTDELITVLAKNPALRVISRTSVMQYKGAHRPVGEIARELGVDGILEGSVARRGERLHLNLQLIHAPTDRHVWAESYDRNANDAILLPVEAASSIALKLKKEGTTEKSPRYVSPEAHDAYLRGRYYESAGDYSKAIASFIKATELQPDYALAWSELSFSYGRSALSTRPPANIEKNRAAIRRAVELDDTSPEVQNTFALFVLFGDWDWDRALSESAKAVELGPGFAQAHCTRAKVLLVLKGGEGSLEEMKKCKELDPRDDPGALANHLFLKHHYDEALEAVRVVEETHPERNSPHVLLAWIYMAQGRPKEAAQEMAQAHSDYGISDRVFAAKLAASPDGAKKIIRIYIEGLKKQSSREYVTPMEFARTYALLGEKEETLHYLEMAYEARHGGMVYLQVEPWFDFVHAEPRYQAIVRKMGLPPTY